MLRIWRFVVTLTFTAHPLALCGQGNVNLTELNHNTGEPNLSQRNLDNHSAPRTSKLARVTLGTPRTTFAPVSWQNNLPKNLSIVTLGRPALIVESAFASLVPDAAIQPPSFPTPQSMPTLEIVEGIQAWPLSSPDVDKKGQPNSGSWRDEVLIPQISPDQTMSVSLSALVPAALRQSKIIEIARLQSFLELEKVTQTDANFDWTLFTKNIWTDTDEPTGSDLDAGPGSKRKLEEDLAFDAGLRRTNRLGGQFESTQNVRLNHTNSQFIDPQDRGISRMTLRYTQPLLRDGGKLVNEGQVVLAQLKAEATNAEYQTQINDVLQRVVQAYWELYRSRADYCIRLALVVNTRELRNELERRRRIDAQPALVAQVESQLAAQLADLRASLVKIQRAQHDLVRQVGDRTLDVPVELIPQETPFAEPIHLDIGPLFSTAIQNRGELRSALKRIQSSTVNNNIAQHQLLPKVALILETYVSGINGDYKAVRSIGDQFSERAPTYSVGFTYEFPIGNRAARSRAKQAEISITREITTFEDTIDQIRQEVRDALASLKGFADQAEQRNEAVTAANVEVNALLERRTKFPEEFDQVSQLYIRTYLDALQRRAVAEQALVSSHVDYSISLVQLRRALGVLLSVNN